jgi:hypothetical protein
MGGGRNSFNYINDATMKNEDTTTLNSIYRPSIFSRHPNDDDASKSLKLFMTPLWESLITTVVLNNKDDDHENCHKLSQESGK